MWTTDIDAANLLADLRLIICCVLCGMFPLQLVCPEEVKATGLCIKRVRALRKRSANVNVAMWRSEANAYPTPSQAAIAAAFLLLPTYCLLYL